MDGRPEIFQSQVESLKILINSCQVLQICKQHSALEDHTGEFLKGYKILIHICAMLCSCTGIDSTGLQVTAAWLRDTQASCDLNLVTIGKVVAN